MLPYFSCNAYGFFISYSGKNGSSFCKKKRPGKISIYCVCGDFTYNNALKPPYGICNIFFPKSSPRYEYPLFSCCCFCCAYTAYPQNFSKPLLKNIQRLFLARSGRTDTYLFCTKHISVIFSVLRSYELYSYFFKPVDFLSFHSIFHVSHQIYCYCRNSYKRFNSVIS